MGKNTNVLNKKGVINKFQIIGEAKINDYTYKIDEKSTKSDWIYNSFNLGVDAGDYGVVYAELMGGYAAERDNVIYVHGKTDDGKDDFENQFTIDWDDRNNPTFLDDVGEMCFITVGLEKKTDGKTFYKKFLTAYDAIAYIKEHLTDGAVINVKGSLKYGLYNGRTTIKKEINSIVLSTADDKSKYRANFTQTVLLDRYSVGEIDKEKETINIEAKVIDYTKFYNDKEVKTFIPFPVNFEFDISGLDNDKVKKIISKLLKVKSGVTEITFEGKLMEGATIMKATYDDLTDDLKECIDMGVMTEEEALVKCVVSTNRERRMIFTKPYFKPIKNEGDIPQMARIDNKYTEEDLILDFMIEEETVKNEPELETESVDNDLGSDLENWLDELD